MLKNDRPKFRGNRVFSNVRNMLDPRTVIIYKLKSTVTQEQIDEFFTRVAANSKRIVPLPPAEG